MFECKKNKVHGLAGSQLPRNRWYTWQMTTVTFQSGSPATPIRSSSRVRKDQTATSKMDVAWPVLSRNVVNLSYHTLYTYTLIYYDVYVPWHSGKIDLPFNSLPKEKKLRKLEEKDEGFHQMEVPQLSSIFWLGSSLISHPAIGVSPFISHHFPMKLP